MTSGSVSACVLGFDVSDRAKKRDTGTLDAIEVQGSNMAEWMAICSERGCGDLRLGGAIVAKSPFLDPRSAKTRARSPDNEVDFGGNTSSNKFRVRVVSCDDRGERGNDRKPTTTNNTHKQKRLCARSAFVASAAGLYPFTQLLVLQARARTANQVQLLHVLRTPTKSDILSDIPQTKHNEDYTEPREFTKRTKQIDNNRVSFAPPTDLFEKKSRSKIHKFAQFPKRVSAARARQEHASHLPGPPICSADRSSAYTSKSTIILRVVATGRMKKIRI